MNVLVKPRDTHGERESHFKKKSFESLLDTPFEVITSSFMILSSRCSARKQRRLGRLQQNGSLVAR